MTDGGGLPRVDRPLAQDEGTLLPVRTVWDFVGSGVTVTDLGDKLSISIPGGGGGGAPVDATYVVGSADPTLTAELVLGTAVILAGVIAARPAPALAGRLYAATDEGILYRDDGAAWSKIAVRDHADLDGVTADQHHAQLHAAAHAENAGDELLVEALGTGSLVAGRYPRTDGLGGLAIAQVDHGELTGVTIDQHHARDHALDGSTHTLSGSVAGRFLRATGATTFAIEAVPFSVPGSFVSPAAINLVTWRAPFACTVTNVRGYRVGGTGATVNGRRNGTSNHLASDLSLTSADTWMDGGAVQNTAYVAGDSLELRVVSVAGSPTLVVVQVDFTRP